MQRRAARAVLAVAAAGILAVSARAAAPAAVPVAICGPHHRALAHWLSAGQDGTLPRGGVTVIHIDAHPDLAVPAGSWPSGWPARPASFVARTDIATFQLAAVRAGLVDEIVWLRPSWARQLADGEYRISVGQLASGELRVDDPSDYYVLDGGWAARTALHDVQTLRLRVMTLEAALEAGEPLASGPTILDVDLDVFATHNPAADRLRRAGLSDADLARVREIFDPAGLALAADPAARTQQVAELTDSIAALAGGEWRRAPGAVLVFWRRGIGPLDLWDLYGILGRAEGRAVDTLIEEGLEVIGLPEHRADPAEVTVVAARVRALLERELVRPDLVTVARSVDDGFTPREAWPAIEWELLSGLAAVLPRGAVRLDAGQRPAPRPPEPGGATPRWIPPEHPRR